jgi:hypothetical protein
MTQFYKFEGGAICITFLNASLKRKFYSLFPVVQSYVYFKIQELGRVEITYGPILASAGSSVFVSVRPKVLNALEMLDFGDLDANYKSAVEIVGIEFVNHDD